MRKRTVSPSRTSRRVGHAHIDSAPSGLGLTGDAPVLLLLADRTGFLRVVFVAMGAHEGCETESDGGGGEQELAFAGVHEKFLVDVLSDR
jgi:hypothetical protein